MTDDLIAQFVDGDLSPSELASRLNLSLRELAIWAGKPENVRLLSSIAHLADLRAQMLVARYRATAAAQLIAIATQEEPGESSRKACVDLLEANLNVFAPRESKEPDAPSPPSEEAILEALAQLGEK